jgi:hypothetical protein
MCVLLDTTGLQVSDLVLDSLPNLLPNTKPSLKTGGIKAAHYVSRDVDIFRKPFNI